jgi:hypothetical protein
MQNAKDSFYIALRNRLAVVNPSRTILLRGVQRPGIVVEEAEADAMEWMNDVFTLRWTEIAVMEELPSVLWSMQCAVYYATSGSQPNVGLDRGRAMAQMDFELSSMLAPALTPKENYTVTPAVTMQTQVFWGNPIFGALDTVREQLLRTATVTVYAFEEPEER